MGKIASKIWSKGLIGGFGIPQMCKAVEPLASWSRSDLIDAYQHYLDYCEGPSMDRHEFTDVFQCFTDIVTADAAFKALKPKKGRVDANTIFAAAVATSNQSFISKVSLIFSIFDVNSDGILGKAEFTAALRSLLNGLKLFYTDAIMPGDAELEVAIDQCFVRIDCDRSGSLTLGEFVVYSYRNRELQEMLETVPTEDYGIFEDSVPFQRRVTTAPGEGDPEEPMVKHHSIPEPPVVKRHSLEPSFRRQRLSLPMHDEMPMSARTERRRSTGVGVRRPRGVADAGGGGTWCGSVAYVKLTGRKRSSSLRPARVTAMPPDVSKAQAWMLWKFFHHLSGHRSNADLDVVLDFLKDQIAVKKEFLRIAGQAKSDEPLKEGQAEPSQDERTETKATDSPSSPTRAPTFALRDADFAVEVETLSSHFQRTLLDPQVRNRLEWLRPCPMTLRAFLCLSFSSLNPANIESIMAWCNAFHALEILKDLLSNEAIAVSDEELEVLFRYIDSDGSGDITMSELVLGGHLTKVQAEELFEQCRRKKDAAISDKDLRNYIKGLSMAPGQDMKGVLATFANSPKVRTPEMSTPEPMDSTEPCPEGAGETTKER